MMIMFPETGVSFHCENSRLQRLYGEAEKSAAKT